MSHFFSLVGGLGEERGDCISGSKGTYRSAWICAGRKDADGGGESLPGALGAYALGVGVGRIGERLPEAAYALLSGLNGATVGIVAVAAVSGFVLLLPSGKVVILNARCLRLLLSSDSELGFFRYNSLVKLSRIS